MRLDNLGSESREWEIKWLDWSHHISHGLEV